MVRLKYIPSEWICDGKPAYGVSDKQIISDNPDEDPHILLSGNTKHGPEKYWCIQFGLLVFSVIT